jgi:hypothetical protein
VVGYEGEWAGGEEVNEEGYNCPDDIGAWADGTDSQDWMAVVIEAVEAAAVGGVAVTFDVAVHVEDNVVVEEDQALDLDEERSASGVEWAVGVVTVAVDLSSDLSARRIHDDSCLLSVQNIFCKNSRHEEYEM